MNHDNVKFFTEKGMEFSKIVAKAMFDAAKDIGSSAIVKESASAAAVGAAIAIPLPLLGPATGAIIGATFGAYCYLKKSK